MNSKHAPEINAGSMADIAFLLLVFFLVTTTMDTELGMIRKLPKTEEINQKEILQRNVLEVMINSADEIMVEGEIVSIYEVSEIAKEFIVNKNNVSNMPEKVMLDVPILGSIEVSKQVISLQNDRETSYEIYLKVQNELARAYNQLRDDLAMEKFNKSFDELKKMNQMHQYKAVKMVYPQRISEALPHE
jgi:biopolymer transport protein ExbD